jgi:hypothetical protein
MVLVCQPGQRTKVILLPATISRFRPEKPTHADDDHADINRVINREDHEIVDQNQWDMNECADAKSQQMDQDADVRRAPAPKPDSTLVLVKVDSSDSIPSSRDVHRTGIRKPSEYP